MKYIVLLLAAMAGMVESANAANNTAAPAEYADVLTAYNASANTYIQLYAGADANVSITIGHVDFTIVPTTP